MNESKDCVSSKPRVTIVILNWNRGLDTIECLASLNSLRYPNRDVIVVDNASTDRSLEAIKAEYPDIRTITNNTNLGFAEGNNVGIRAALDDGADYIFLLNNDTIVDPLVLNDLIETVASDPNIGIVGPKIYYYDDPEMIWFAGGLIKWQKGLTAHIGKDHKDIGQYDKQIDMDYATGCGFLVKSEVFNKIGLFDERFFLYFEEADFCVRATHAGYRIVFSPKAKIWHKVSMSTGGQRSALGYYYYARNRLLLCRKELKGTRWMSFVLNYSSGLISETIKIVISSESEKYIKIKALWIGVWDYLSGRFGKGPGWL